MAKEPEQELTLPLSAEERRSRVAAVRKLDADLQLIENALLDAAARLPGIVREVKRIRGEIDKNTRPASAKEEDA